MTDPWVASDGWSYEKAALKAYIQMQKQQARAVVSPKTGEAIQDLMMPNHMLRHQIERWMHRVWVVCKLHASAA